MNFSSPKLSGSKLRDPGQVISHAEESANISELPVTDAETDASVLLPFAAETMLKELEKLPDESKSLTGLVTGLSHLYAVHGNCSKSSCDIDHEITNDLLISEIRHIAQNKKPICSRVSEAPARIAELKENSRKMVSMFIPPIAQKLPFSNDALGMCFH